MDLIQIGRMWEEVKVINSRCEDITTSDLNKVHALVLAFNTYMGSNVIYRVTGCEIPYISDTIAKHLLKHGLIEHRFAKTLKPEIKPFYEF